MAKRVRGSSTRPGQRPPLQRSTSARPGSTTGSSAAPTTAAPAPTSRPATLTPEEEARAAELEAQILAEEQAAEAASKRNRDRSRRDAPAEPVLRGTIATRAAAEYGYVARDLRRVAIIGGGLVAFLLGLWVVVEATGVGPF